MQCPSEAAVWPIGNELLSGSRKRYHFLAPVDLSITVAPLPNFLRRAIMPAILKGGQIVDRVLTTRNARLAPRPTLWKEYASRVKAGSGHQSVPRIQLSLLLFVDKRRDSSGLLVVGDGGHFLPIGRNRDLRDTVNLAIALVSQFDDAVPQLLHRHSLIRIDAFHRILFAIKLGFPALAGRCGHAHPIARRLPRAGDPSSVFIEVLEMPRTGGRIGSARPLGNPHKLDFCLVGLAAVGGISTPVLTNGACVDATRKCRINC